jgi:outer membrane protein TolC
MFGWRLRWLFGASALALVTMHGKAEEPRDSSALDARLAEEAHLSWMVELADKQSPLLAESVARERAARTLAEHANGLPDTELKSEIWAVPLERPYALRHSEMMMFGLRQALPSKAARNARERIAKLDGELAGAQRALLQRELHRRLAQGFYAFSAADRTLVLYGEHVALAEQMLTQSRANYEAGRGRQQELLDGLTELARLHASVAGEQQQRDESRLLLNTLIGRDVDAPLGRAHPPTAAETLARADQALAQHGRERPEHVVARSLVMRAQTQAEGARHAARRPGFMVGADYFWMPMRSEPHAYGAMASMTLPWLNPERRAAARAAEETVRAERHVEDATRRNLAYELHKARAALQAEKTRFALLDRELLPQAERSLTVARGEFGAGQGGLSALLATYRSYYQLRIEHVRGQARLLDALSAVSFAAGVASVAGVGGEPSHD